MNRNGYFILAVVVLTSARLYAQPPGLMGQSRYDDNVNALATDSLHKYTPTPFLKGLYFNNRKNVGISFGGELREQAQAIQNELWGAAAASSEAAAPYAGKPFLLQRYLLHTNLQLSRYVRVFAELASGTQNGKPGTGRPGVDVDKLDLHQLFADFAVFPAAKTVLTLRVGRQELAYGASRLVNTNEGLNAKLSFQGVKLLADFDGTKIDAFYTNRVNNSAGVFDDAVNKSVQFYGLYSSWKKPALTDNHLEVYVLGYSNNKNQYARNTGREDRYSAGIRVYSSSPKAFSYEVEATYQWGKIATAPISAYMLIAKLGYTFNQASSKPTLGFIAQMASGDKAGNTTLNTYNPMFALVYYGLRPPYWPANLIQLAPIINLKPLPKLTIDGAARAFWRQSTGDGLYLSGTITRSPFITGTTTLSDHRFVGFQFDLDPAYAITSYFTLGADLSFIPATSDYIRETGPAQGIFFTNLQARLRF